MKVVAIWHAERGAPFSSFDDSLFRQLFSVE
jgi:hypothetical protein